MGPTRSPRQQGIGELRSKDLQQAVVLDGYKHVGERFYHPTPHRKALQSHPTIQHSIAQRCLAQSSYSCSKQ